MVALDIFIGLVLIYFLYSLLSSIIAEMIATWIGMRARLLRQGIENLLNDKQPVQTTLEGFYSFLNEYWSLKSAVQIPGFLWNKFVYSGFAGWLKDIFLVEPAEFKFTTAGRFYHEPTIKYLGKVGDNVIYSTRHTKPAYISKENFTHTVLNMLTQRSQGINEWDKIKFAIRHNAMSLGPETHKTFQDWVARSDDNYSNFITNIERTYEDMMDRVGGWYKRKIGLFLFVLGFTMCMLMNVDTIDIVKILANNPEKRKEMVELAIKTIETQDKYITDTSNRDSVKRADSLQWIKLQEQYLLTKNSINETKGIMASGWVYPDSIYSQANVKNKKFLKVKHIIYQSVPFWKLKFWGLLITALALGLGAQFWYDLLKKLVALRGAGVKPEERDEKLKKELEIKKTGNSGLELTTKDLVEIAIAENREYWESLPGYISANASFDKSINKKFVQLAFTKGNKPFDTENIKVNDESVLVKAVEGEKGGLVAFTENEIKELAEGALIQNETNSWGTPAGILFDRRRKKRVILTCGHVVRPSKTVFFDPEKTIIHYKPKSGIPVPIGRVRNIVMSAFCDAGVIEINDDFDMSLIKDKIPEIKTFREAKPIDNESTIIKIKNLTNIVQEGKILRTRENHTFDDGGIDVRYLDLIIIGEKNNNITPISKKGDSGALIYDSHDIPIGIVVGGAEINNKHFTYGIKLKDIIEILQLQTI